MIKVFKSVKKFSDFDHLKFFERQNYFRTRHNGLSIEARRYTADIMRSFLNQDIGDWNNLLSVVENGNTIISLKIESADNSPRQK